MHQKYKYMPNGIQIVSKNNAMSDLEEKQFLEYERKYQKKLRKLVENKDICNIIELPNIKGESKDKGANRDERQIIHKLQKIKELSDASKKINKKNFYIDMEAIDDFIEDLNPKENSNRHKDSPNEKYRSDSLLNDHEDCLQVNRSDQVLEQVEKRNKKQAWKKNLEFLETTELTNLEYIPIKQTEKSLQKSNVKDKYNKIRLNNTLYDLKFSRSKSQNGLEYQGKFSKKLNHSTNKVNFNSLDESFIFKSVSKFLDDFQKDILTDSFIEEDMDINFDPYKKVIPYLQEQMRLTKIDPEEMDKETLEKVLAAKLQALLGDKYMKQIFARCLLDNMQVRFYARLHKEKMNPKKEMKNRSKYMKDNKVKIRHSIRSLYNKNISESRASINEEQSNLFERTKTKIMSVDERKSMYIKSKSCFYKKPVNEMDNKGKTVEATGFGQILQSTLQAPKKLFSNEDNQTEKAPKKEEGNMNFFAHIFNKSNAKVFAEKPKISSFIPPNIHRTKSTKIDFVNNENFNSNFVSIEPVESQMFENDPTKPYFFINKTGGNFENSNDLDFGNNDKDIKMNKTVQDSVKFLKSENSFDENKINERKNVFSNLRKTSKVNFDLNNSEERSLGKESDLQSKSQKRVTFSSNRDTNSQSSKFGFNDARKNLKKILNENLEGPIQLDGIKTYKDLANVYEMETSKQDSTNKDTKEKIFKSTSPESNPMDLEKLNKYKYLKQFSKQMPKKLSGFVEKQIWDKALINQKAQSMGKLGFAQLQLNQGIFDKPKKQGYGKYHKMKINLNKTVTDMRKKNPNHDLSNIVDKFVSFKNQFNDNLKVNAKLSSECRNLVYRIKDDRQKKLKVQEIH